MVYTYTPTYYTSLQDSITSICKNILPFSFKKRRIPAIAGADQRLSKQQSDNLKWQQDSFHKIVNLMGLCTEGIVHENEVSALRTRLLETLIASPVDHESPEVLRDKLIFLQELLYAKCISEEEYHASKRPLLQRLAVQGAEIDARDVIVGVHKETSNEEWSIIDLKDEKCFSNKSVSLTSKKTSTVKRMKGAAESVLAFVSSDKIIKLKENNRTIAANKRFGTKDHNVSMFLNGDLDENKSDSKSSILMVGSSPGYSDKTKRKPFRTIFQGEQERCSGNENGEEKEDVRRKAWAFDGFKKWKKNYFKDEILSLSLNEKSDEENYAGKLVANPVWEGPDTMQIKRKLHPNGAPTDFFVDKVLGENIKKELFRIQTELGGKNPDVQLLDDHIEAISTRLPVDKEDLKKFFPKSWCDQHGDIVLDVVRKEFKKHMTEMGKSRGKVVETQHNTFRDENSRPDNVHSSVASSNNIDKCFT